VCHNPARTLCLPPLCLLCRESRELVLFQQPYTTLAASGAGDINYSALTPAGAIWQILASRAIGHQTEWPLSSNKDPTRSYCLFGLSFSLCAALSNREDRAKAKVYRGECELAQCHSHCVGGFLLTNKGYQITDVSQLNRAALLTRSGQSNKTKRRRKSFSASSALMAMDGKLNINSDGLVFRIINCALEGLIKAQNLSGQGK
jgi:hypothetical protein